MIKHFSQMKLERKCILHILIYRHCYLNVKTVCVFPPEVIQLCLDKRDKQVSQKVLYLKDNDSLRLVTLKIFDFFCIYLVMSSSLSYSYRLQYSFVKDSNNMVQKVNPILFLFNSNLTFSMDGPSWRLMTALRLLSLKPEQ